MKELAKIQLVYTDGSTKEVTKGAVFDISSTDAIGEFLNCEVEDDIKPLLRSLIMTLRDLKIE